METNLYYCTRTGRTISEKTMEDGNVISTKDDKITSLANLYNDRAIKQPTNGHDICGEASSPPGEPYDQRRLSSDAPKDDKIRKRINPLRIHLGKRPFVDNSLQCYSAGKKKKPYVNKNSDIAIPNAVPRVPKLIPKKAEATPFHNVAPQVGSTMDNEEDKPVPRLVPKSQLLQFKKGKVEKGAQLKEYAQSLGLQPMVKFKCRKCCSMSFKTLAMLKEHQLVCRAQAKEPALSPEATPSVDTNSGGPSRVTRKVYLCSACGTYYENWNLFLHMREVHNRHICLFCLGMFSKAEKLSSHLTNKHNVQEFNYESKDEFFKVYNGTLYLMCCVCDEICSEQDDFVNHDCSKIKPRPLPVRVNRNSNAKSNVKNTKSFSDNLNNGPISATKDHTKPLIDRKEIANEPKLDIISAHNVAVATNDSEPIHSDTSLSSDNSATASQDTSNTIDSGMELDSSSSKPLASPMPEEPVSPAGSDHPLPNGDESIDQSDESDSPIPDEMHSPLSEPSPVKCQEPISTPIEKEKEGGIKLKLSLNKANSPVIINSTVDPTIGQQNQHKPPTRMRRPPKRYEKEKTEAIVPPVLAQPKTPSIKMTICDKADSPFVKTTIFEDNKETTLRTLLNNNLCKDTNKTPEYKPENMVKTTIYDNNIEDVNTLNRVPKLTVRVPKELLDKDSSSDYSSDSDANDKLTVDENNITIDEENKIKQEPETLLALEPPVDIMSEEDAHIEVDEKMETSNNDLPVKKEADLEAIEQNTIVEPKVEEPEIPVTELSLDKPLDKYPLKDLLKVFLTLTSTNCIYCNHVRKIAVNCEQLSLHMVAQHRFTATVNSITAEELMPETITARLKAGAEEMRPIFINLNSYDSVDKYREVQYEHMFECFQCYFKTAVHKDLCFHNRKMHQKTILLCVMCKTSFYSYSELLCHLCPGAYDSEYEIKFRCCLCNIDSIPSSFRLMVHLRKVHHTCDVCLEFCHSQARLSNHVWKHKLHHLCYRCGIAYRNKPDITNHLFWKHGTQSVLCKRCLQKRWPHVYHFCTPPAIFVCDECSLQFTRAVCLKVHRRFHSGDYPHECKEEGCTEKFVSKKLLAKHMDVHKNKIIEENNEEKPQLDDKLQAVSKESIPVIDLVQDKPKEEGKPSEVNNETSNEQLSKKAKKKKLKEKDALLLDVNLPALDLSESDSSDESDNGLPPPKKEDIKDIKPNETFVEDTTTKEIVSDGQLPKIEDKVEPQEEEKPSEQQILDIWDNFKKYQAKVEKQKEKTPPLVPIRKHVCESDHDYCLIPTDTNGEEDTFSLDKKKNKKSPKKRHGGLSSSSSSSSDSDSSCSCGSNCSCSSSSGSSSSSSSDSDSSDDSLNEKKEPLEKKKKKLQKKLPNRRLSNGSNVDVMGMSETPILIPEKVEPPIAETDLETTESETDEEFYDKHPQQIANKLHAEKRNQLMMLASVAPSDGGSVSGETSRPNTPIKEDDTKVEPKIEPKIEIEDKEKPTSSKKKSKKKKKSKNSKRHGPIKLNIPKDIIAKSEPEPPQPLVPNKITISLHSNTVQLPETPIAATISSSTSASKASIESKRASKRRRVPNKFYGYSSDEETSSPAIAALKPQQPPKLEWRKEDLPSPVTHKVKKEVPSTVIPQRLFNYTEPIRLTTPIPDPEPPRILMNTESMESSDSDSSEGNLEIYQPQNPHSSAPIPPPTYLNSGTSSLPYAFQRPAVRQAREGESVYCYCRCPYDEVSEMIACDAEGCPIEWFHFECVGIMVPPKGKWYCPECRKNQSFSGYR